MPSKLLNILIYCGPGTCQFSVQQTLRTLQKHLQNSYDVKLVNLDSLKCDRIPWEDNCAMFVMPGGRDSIYLDVLKGSKFIEKLRGNVMNGKMKYLGICAGAYFAADRIEFEIGRNNYEIKGDRPLKLIETSAIGPIKMKKHNNLFFYSNDPTATASQISDSLQSVVIRWDEKEIKLAYNGGCYFPDVAKRESVFASYSDYEPAILLTDNFCLSGVHFEYDPIDCLKLEHHLFSELIKFECDRTNLTKEILKRLGLIVKESPPILDIIKVYTRNSNGLKFEDKTIEIIAYNNNVIENPIFFSLYSPICTSTQTILLKDPELLDKLPNYSVYHADHQICGRGRTGNSWISSPACLQFTLKLEHSMKTSNRLPLIQFLMAIAVTETLNSFKFKDSNQTAKIKWPNDIYLVKQCMSSKSSESDNHYSDSDKINDPFSRNVYSPVGKLAGILVNCTQSHKKAVNQVLIGVGLNLLSDPSLPNITHLNDHLQLPCAKETVLYETLERFKQIYEKFLQEDRFPFQEYYSNWIHSNQQIQDDDAQGHHLNIIGIDEFGYLLAKSRSDSQVYKYEPDGNSFDMMKNLIKRKK